MPKAATSVPGIALTAGRAVEDEEKTLRGD
jgi:hypothetical protein